jgi:tRNA G18 (ribose-2'-O)-methylase SpoU
LFAVEQTIGSTLLDKYQWDSNPLALIFGNEVEGVQDEVLNKCDGCLEIPQLGMKHSLNIAVATGMVLWEVFSQFRIRQASH